MAFVLRFLSMNLSVYEMLYKACVASAKEGDLPGSDPFSIAPSIIANCRHGTFTISTFFAEGAYKYFNSFLRSSIFIVFSFMNYIPPIFFIQCIHRLLQTA